MSAITSHHVSAASAARKLLEQATDDGYHSYVSIGWVTHADAVAVSMTLAAQGYSAQRTADPTVWRVYHIASRANRERMAAPQE